MRKIIFVGLLLVAAAVALVIRSPGLEIGLEVAEPRTVSVEASASERIVAASGGKATAADRAHAADRARWKAYYYAQLRAAELQETVEVESRTRIRGMELGGQVLEAAWKGQVRAAPLADDAVRVEFDGDVARARVVLEVPVSRTQGPTERLLALIGSLRLRLGSRRAAKPSSPTTAEPTTQAVAHSSGSPPAQRQRSPALPRQRPPAPLRGQSGGVRPLRSSKGRGVAKSTGAIVTLPRSGPMIGVFPTFYDARGTPLGSADDMAPERRLAGLPLMSSGSVANMSRWAGANPRRYQGTVSRGDVFLRTTLGVDEARAFRDGLRHDRVVILIDEDS